MACKITHYRQRCLHQSTVCDTTRADRWQVWWHHGEQGEQVNGCYGILQYFIAGCVAAAMAQLNCQLPFELMSQFWVPKPCSTACAPLLCMPVHMLLSCLCLQLLLKLLNIFLLLLQTQPALLLHSLLLCTIRPLVVARHTCAGKGVLQLNPLSSEWLRAPLVLVTASLAASSTLHAAADFRFTTSHHTARPCLWRSDRRPQGPSAAGQHHSPVPSLVGPLGQATAQSADMLLLRLPNSNVRRQAGPCK